MKKIKISDDLVISDPLQHVLVARDRWRSTSPLSIPNPEQQFRLTGQVRAIGSCFHDQTDGQWFKDLKIGDTVVFDRSGGYQLDLKNVLLTPSRIKCLLYKD